MTLTPGTRLGPYEIVTPLGAGGMGEVYRAKDSRLGRDVAVKVLPQHLSTNPEVRARFEREAKTISSLNHPHICTLHDVGREGDTDYLVMELIEGETLGARLAKGALPTAEVLKLGAQIADALDRAHRAGVIHRDLKPGNVMLTKSGTKLMDFGLARGAAGSGAAGPVSGSGATMAALTQSPEQLEGKEADARSDLWALGCVLYEMVTGRRAFDGKSQASLIGAIMNTDPPSLSEQAPDPASPGAPPPALDRAVKQCLAKDPDDRWQTASDLRRELLWIAEAGSGAGAKAPAPAAGRLRSWTPIVAVAAALAMGTYVGWRVLPSRGGHSSGPGGSASVRVTAMAQLTDLPGRQYGPCLSPDGKMLLYVSIGGADEDIFLLRVGGENPVNLTESYAGADYDPAFSPDGERIAFASSREGGGIFVMGATGESPKKLASDGAHPSWSPDGRKIVYSTERILSPYGRNTVASLWVVDVATGEKKRIYEGDAVQPVWSPSGRRIAFWAADQGQRDLKTIPAEGGAAKAVTKDLPADWDPFWAPDGRSLFFLSDRGGSPDLWRVAIDEASGEVRGEPEPVTTGVARVMAGSISADGQRVAVMVDEARGEILRMGFDPSAGRPQGAPVPVFASSNAMVQLDISRDGGWIAYRATSPRENIFVMRSDGTARRRLTDDAFRNRGPRWMRGTDWLAFYSNRGGSYQIWIMRPDGTELRMLTDRREGDINIPVVSPDGARMAMNVIVGGLPKLGIAGVEETWFTPGKAPQPIAFETIADGFVAQAWSPDGSRMAGLAITPQGGVPAVYSLATNRFEPRMDLEGLAVYGMTWLPDSRHLLSWDALRNTAVLWDAESREVRDVAGIPGPSELRLSADGRTLVLNRTVLEGDIWILTLK